MRTPKIDERAVGMYEKDLLPCSDIARVYGVSRTAVWKYLQAHGVDTSDRLRETKCANCGETILRARKRVRTTRYSCCSKECYYALIKNDEYQQNRTGQRIAREVLGTVIVMKDKYISHHVDGDDLNNEISNLWAFRSHGDHMKYHRGSEAEAFTGKTQEWKVMQKRLGKATSS